MKIFRKTCKFNCQGNKKISYCLGAFIFLILFQAQAFDASEFGDFSSRSVIEGELYKRSNISQNLKDTLQDKKLAPTHACLFEQIRKGNYDNVKLLLEAKVNPNKSYMGEYAIYIAAKENKFDILKLLYENKAQLDRGFYSELYEAIRLKNTEMAQYLLDRGARVNYTSSITNDTILYLALKNKMYDISSKIIAKGAYADNRSVKYIKKHKLQSLIPQQ